MAPTSSARRTDAEGTLGRSSVSLPLVGEARRPDQTPTEIQLSDGDWILPLIKRAQEATVKQAAAVRIMGIAKTQYIENLQGEGHLSVRRLGLLPREFWEELIVELRAHYHMDNDAERLDRALDGAVRCLQQIGEIARKQMR